MWPLDAVGDAVAQFAFRLRQLAGLPVGEGQRAPVFRQRRRLCTGVAQHCGQAQGGRSPARRLAGRLRRPA
jgi:hypothetical protein